MSRRLLVAVAVLLWAAPAHATLYYLSSYENGFPQVEPTPVDFNYWKAQPTPTTGTPHMPLVTTAPSPVPVPSGVVDRYVLRFQPQGGADHYRLLDQGISGGKTSLNATFSLYINDPGPAGTVCELVAFGNGTTDGAVLTMVSNGSTSDPTLNVYIGNSTTTRCSGSNVNDRTCTNDSDITDECTTTNPAEAQCSVLVASTTITKRQQWRSVTLTQANGSGATAGQITGGMYEGAFGAAYSRSSDAIRVGFCAGGSNANNPCDVNADCPSSTCTTSGVVSITQVRLGKTGTGTCAADWSISGLAYYDGAVVPNAYFAALDPSAIATPDSNWAALGTGHSCDTNNRPACVNDGANSGADGATSALDNGNAAKPTIAVNFADAATPTAAATPIAIVLEAVAEDAASGGANSSVVQLRPEYQGTVTPNPTPVPFDLESFVGTGGSSDPYYLMPPTLWERAWTGANINSLTGVLNKTSGSGNNGRVTAMEATVLYQTADPPVPAIIPDRDQDGSDTLCIPGDSTFHNVDLQNAIVGNLVEPSDIYFYTRGGSKLGDTAAQWLSILEGASGGFLPLNVRRGSSGKTCDVVLLEHTANVMGNSIADPSFASTFQGIGKGSYCQDDGGADQGNQCSCDGKTDDWTSQFGATPAPQVTPAKRYCLNHGDFKHEARNGAVVASYCNCASNADCAVGGDGLTATCSGGVCVGLGLGSCAVNAATNARAFFHASGCLNAPGCPNGVCVRARSPQAVMNAYKEIQAATDARPTPNPAATPAHASGKPIVVYMAAPPGYGLACWDKTRFSAGVYRTNLKVWAKANGYPYIDMYARFQQQCDMYAACPDPCTTNERGCFRDDVHWNQRGQVTVAAGVITECLTNALPGETAGTRTHDGVCTSSVCTSGLSGDSCSADADCDTWSCDFGAQP